jgi:hypothetical protein
MSTLLDQHGAVYVKGLLPVEFCQYFTHALMRKSDEGKSGDSQIPNAKAIIDHEIMFDTLLERLWPTIESLAGEELLPTYAYSRLYSNGDELEKHKDRDACEVSVTLQLGRSHNYAWPIYAGNMRFDLAEGDGVLYKGCDVEHWREPCAGPEGYYSGQVFLHYVKKNGDRAKEYADPMNRSRSRIRFVKDRTLIMEAK